MRILQKARCLRELAKAIGLHGLYFQHVALCRRRAWLHLMGATHAAHHARVQRLSKDALGGPMRQDEDTWHGKNWSIL